MSAHKHFREITSYKQIIDLNPWDVRPLKYQRYTHKQIRALSLWELSQRTGQDPYVVGHMPAKSMVFYPTADHPPDDWDGSCSSEDSTNYLEMHPETKLSPQTPQYTLTAM